MLSKLSSIICNLRSGRLQNPQQQSDSTTNTPLSFTKPIYYSTLYSPSTSSSMDRTLDEIVSERHVSSLLSLARKFEPKYQQSQTNPPLQRGSSNGRAGGFRGRRGGGSGGGPRRNDYRDRNDYPRDGVRKVSSFDQSYCAFTNGNLHHRCLHLLLLILSLEISWNLLRLIAAHTSCSMLPRAV